MYIINLNGGIDSKTLKFLIKELNTTGYGDHICIYINSTGGEVDIAEAIIEAIDRFSMDRKITLIAYWEVSSSAFQIFMRSNCEKKVLPHAHAVIHKTIHHQNSLMIDRRDPLHSGMAKQNEKLQAEKLYWLASIGITESEMDVINNSGDVYLDAQRLRELAASAELLKTRKQDVVEMTHELVIAEPGQTLNIG